jgi:DNA-binding XRE family transcriptional regulator
MNKIKSVKNRAKERLNRLPPKHRNEVISDLRLISSAVQTRRKALGMTQEELAEQLDIAPTTVQFIEQQRRYPSLPMLLYICRYLELKIKLG